MHIRPLNPLLLIVLPAFLIGCPEKNKEPSEAPATAEEPAAATDENAADDKAGDEMEEKEEKADDGEDEGGW